MATSLLSGILHHLGGPAGPRDGTGPADGQLLADYLRRRDGAALAALVWRHGPMVWGVCRRLLRHHQDAEDAFQATFLVLVRKAATLAAPDRVANWLYGVARQTALNARAAAGRRRARERQVPAMPEPEATPAAAGPDLLPLLDQELHRLPAKYRTLIVLCDLEGLTRRGAAQRLGVPEGTVAGRLARARALLARRLRRHGASLSAGALAAWLAQNATAAVPPAVAAAALRSAAGVVPATVAALTEGVLKTMLLTKLKTALIVVLAVGLLGAGAGRLTLPARAAGPAEPAQKKEAAPKDQTEVSGVIKAVDAARRTVTLQATKGAAGPRTFTLAADAKILLDTGAGDKTSNPPEGKEADLREGSPVTLTVTDGKTIVRVWVSGPTVQGTVKAVDPANGTITVAPSAKGEAATDRTYTVAKNAPVILEDGQVRDKSQPGRSANLADVPVGAVVALRLAADRKTVGAIRAEGPTVRGVLKAVDAAANTVTITTATKGEAAGERTIPVAPGAQVALEDGKAKDKTRPAAGGKLTDLPLGALVTLRLAPTGQTVVALLAEGAQVRGTVKAVDAAKHTLTLHDKSQGEKTYTIGPDAAVYLDGAGEPRKLADVPVGAAVELRLVAGQQAVREVRASGPTVMGRVAGTAGPDRITLRSKEGDRTFTVGQGVVVHLDGQAGGKLSDLIDGTVARVRLAVDQATVLEVSAEGPTFRGKVKALDLGQQTITVTVGTKGDVEDKDFKLTKATAVQTEINNVPLELKDVQVDREVVVRLTIDQKAVARIVVIGQ